MAPMTHFHFHFNFNFTKLKRHLEALCSLALLQFLYENHKRKLGLCGGITRIRVNASTSSSTSSSVNKSKRLNVESNNSGGNRDVFLDEIFLEDPEFERDELSGFRGLVLDISYRPVNVVCWKRAICLEFLDKADVLEYYDQTVNSPGGLFYIPAVLRIPHLMQVVKRRKVKRTLSRKNIFYRDNFTCQYCSSSENLTIDHILPIALGGEWTWENLVTACARCNSRKGQKTLEEANMTLMKVPKAPKDYDLLAIPLTNTAIRMLKMRKGTPEEWRQYLSKPYALP
ncbi:HNH endonuclease [Abeliophyllum distichum]|uniref:HNH endonuclease n=1 Tax=Abeliophyllum distichum TaxID=126358 RepID=A0ABD1QW09_9LAMI